jgi:branched-chain amino acid transport system ATP-binding protein
MMDRPPAFFRADRVTGGYDGVPVVKDADLRVGLGEVVLLMGPNGAGKSTFVKTVTGELTLLGGALTLDGTDISRLGEEDRVAAGVGHVPQVRDVFGPLTVLENLTMGGYQLSSQEVGERRDEMFELFPLLAGLRRRRASSLSGGERKMLAIARALMARPRLLILDEPTANLAPRVAQMVLDEVVAGLAAAGRAILLVEQRVSLGLSVAAWGYVLVDGQVSLSASQGELRANEDLGRLFLTRGVPGPVATPPEGPVR